MRDIVRRPVKPVIDSPPAALRRPGHRRSPWRNKIKRRWRRWRYWLTRHPRLAAGLAVAALSLLVVWSIYSFGYSHGQAAQRRLDEQKISESRQPALGSTDEAQRNRGIFSISGTIESVSATEIVVRSVTGDTKQANFDKDTIINDAKNAKVEAKALKKGDRAFMTGLVVGGANTARRIRVMPARQ